MHAVIGYVRVSTGAQEVNGYGLDAQREAITAECERRGWRLVETVTEARSAKDLRRPVLAAALDRLDAGDADGLVVAKLDRLSRSVLDFATLGERSRRRGWGIACLDIGLDTSTPHGEAMANMIATFAQLERRLISDRTRVAMAAAPAKVRARYGNYQRRSNLPPNVKRRIRRWREGGRSYRAIADALNADGIPAEQGGPWHPNGVRRVALG